MEDSPVIALDLGTTSIKAGIVDSGGILEPVFAESAPPVRRSGNRFESNALEYLDACTDLLSRCIDRKVGSRSVGLCYQRSSFVVWRKASGEPVTPLISWQDSRAEDLCFSMAYCKDQLRKLTGLWLTPFFFAPKVKYLLDEMPALRKGLDSGEFMIGTLDSFLIWHWTKGEIFRTDLSMAARTLLVDPSQQDWSTELTRLFDVSIDWLPHIGRSQSVGVRLKQGVTIDSSVADQSAALLGTLRKDSKQVLVNLGTGGFICCFIDDQHAVENMVGYQKTLVYLDATGKSHFAVEATINSIGRVLSSYSCENCEVVESKKLANHFCVVEPSGLGAPFFREDVKLTFSKSVENVESRQLAGLIVEGVIFRVKQILNDFNRIFGIDGVYLSGGWSRLAVLNQGIAQCSPANVYLLEEKETSLFGAAILASPGIMHCDNRVIQIENNERFEFLNDKYERWLRWLNNFLMRKNGSGSIS